MTRPISIELRRPAVPAALRSEPVPDLAGLLPTQTRNSHRSGTGIRSNMAPNQHIARPYSSECANQFGNPKYASDYSHHSPD